MSWSERKFLSLPLRQQHKKCAEALKREDPAYSQLSAWLGLPPLVETTPRAHADRYHFHLQKAHLSLQEHNLLPRQGDRIAPIASFLPIAIYLDDLRSAFNVGSILRTTEALRLGSVYFSEATPFLDNPKVVKTAMGSAPLVPCHKAPSLDPLPRPWIALEPSDQALPLYSYPFPSLFTLFLGNEEHGISPSLLSQCDLALEIPLWGQKNSLNVASAYAIAAYEIRKQLTIN